MRAADIMQTPAVTIRDDATLEQAARLMLEKRVGGLPVVDDADRVVGFLTESDFAAREEGVPFSLVRAPQLFGRWVDQGNMERAYAEARRLRVADVMSKPAIGVAPDAPLEDVVRKLMEYEVNRLVVVQDGLAVGVVARHDLLRVMAGPG